MAPVFSALIAFVGSAWAIVLAVDLLHEASRDAR